MPRLRTLAGLGAAVGALVAGCAAPASAPPAAPSASPPSVPASSAPSASAPPPGPGAVRLTGDLRRPGEVGADQLAALPRHTVTVDFTSGKGAEHRTEAGVLLADLLPPDAVATTGRRNDLLSFAVLAVGADGYSALVSYGEISPDFGDRGLLLSTNEDGVALARPRLVVPGDRRGGRYVSDVVELHVVRVATG